MEKPKPSTSPVAGWTAARYKGFVTSTLRSGFSKYPNKYKVLKNAATGRRLNPASGKMATFYLCKKCGNEFTSTNVQVDHVKPIVTPTVGFTNWDDFIENLFCGIRNLQVLCKPCHAAKTKKERAKRSKKK